MTQDEFNATRWGAGMTCEYESAEMRVASVNFPERLLGLVDIDAETATAEDISWVRCENIDIVNDGSIPGTKKESNCDHDWEEHNGKEYCTYTDCEEVRETESK